jgi:hypothetical protein
LKVIQKNMQSRFCDARIESILLEVNKKENTES